MFPVSFSRILDEIGDFRFRNKSFTTPTTFDHANWKTAPVSVISLIYIPIQLCNNYLLRVEHLDSGYKAEFYVDYCEKGFNRSQVGCLKSIFLGNVHPGGVIHGSPD